MKGVEIKNKHEPLSAVCTENKKGEGKREEGAEAINSTQCIA